ncbi:expressed unknown protein [Seminavis robusta]|uniref:Sel1 repeat family protein n=1 Tax=Seminavis robusta TaxID=568900 RepID=A0A9N8D4Y9_9STRA|nr:expressed unknown protein [Seminavis robusta]|eukprot:Sro5_g004510.1 n/a (198) ;mRNA; f:174623-175216
MGDTLVPATQIKSLIETLIENGVIQGDLVESWNKKSQQMKEKEELLQKTNDGNEGMLKVVEGFARGVNGFEKNRPKAYRWCQKLHDVGSVKGRARLGEYLVKGLGTQKSFTLGMLHLGQAAFAGSDLAAYLLGYAFAKGKYGMPVKEKEAIFWFRKCLGPCAYSHLSSKTKAKAQEHLNELLDNQNRGSDEGSASSD